MEETNKAVVRKVIEIFLNSADPDVADELFHPDGQGLWVGRIQPLASTDRSRLRFHPPTPPQV